MSNICERQHKIIIWSCASGQLDKFSFLLNSFWSSTDFREKTLEQLFPVYVQVFEAEKMSGNHPDDRDGTIGTFKVKQGVEKQKKTKELSSSVLFLCKMLLA